jgi:hypothetical protein
MRERKDTMPQHGTDTEKPTGRDRPTPSSAVGDGAPRSTDDDVVLSPRSIPPNVQGRHIASHGLVMVRRRASSVLSCLRSRVQVSAAVRTTNLKKQADTIRLRLLAKERRLLQKQRANLLLSLRRNRTRCDANSVKVEKIREDLGTGLARRAKGEGERPRTRKWQTMTVQF